MATRFNFQAFYLTLRQTNEANRLAADSRPHFLQLLRFSRRQSIQQRPLEINHDAYFQPSRHSPESAAAQ